MTQHNQNDHATISERLKDLDKIEAVLIEVGQRVILEHARAGRSIPVWRNNQVVWERIEEDERSKNRRRYLWKRSKRSSRTSNP